MLSGVLLAFGLDVIIQQAYLKERVQGSSTQGDECLGAK